MITGKNSVTAGLILAALLMAVPLSAQEQLVRQRDWSDLYSGEYKKKVYGSEKASRYKIDIKPLIEIEDWEKNGKEFYTLKTLWLGAWFFMNRNYPLFKEKRFFLLYNSFKSKIDNRKKSYLFPLYYQKTDGPYRFSLSPLHYHEKDENDNSSKLLFPLIPFLYFSDISHEGSHRSLLTLINWKSDRRGDIKRFWFTPFFFYKEDGYKHIVPLYFSWSERGTEFRLGLLPPYYHERTERSDLDELIHVNPLIYYKKSGKPGSAKSQMTKALNLPLLPFLYYSRTAPGESHRNLLTLLNWKTDGNWGLSRLWLTPLFYYKKQGYTHIVPLYFSWRKDGHHTRIGVIPPYYHRRTERSDLKGVTHINPLIYYQHSTAISSGSETTTSALNLPLLPFLYYSRKAPGENHRNLLTLLNWKTDGDWGVTRLWLSPLFYYKKQGYAHIVPLYFSWNEGDQQSRIGVIPPYYHRKTVTDNSEELLHANPLIYYKRKSTSSATGEIRNTTALNLPLLPFLYYSRKVPGENHRNLLTLLNWKSDGDWGLTRLWLSPLFYYKKDSYLYILPFYLRPSGYNAERGITLSPVYIHSWSPEQDKLWSLIYYSSDNRQLNEKFSTILPVYYSWNYPTSSGSILLPFYINYESRNKLIHANLLGGSYSIDVGVGPTNKPYLDTEYSFIYNLFSVSSRISLPFAVGSDSETENANIATDPKAMSAEERKSIADRQESEMKTRLPELSRGGESNRDHSEYFWGWQALFGLFAYEQADTRKHLRILPFSWFSWDIRDEVKDHVHFFPGAYISYADAHKKYFVLFPLLLPIYGKQQQGKSFIETYGINIFWREYDDELTRSEYSVLWPLINWYHSPTQNGFRILPLVWHRNHNEKDYSRRNTLILPLFHYSSSYKNKTNQFEKSMTVNPLLFRRSKYEKSEGSQTTIAPLALPLYFVHSTTRQIGDYRHGVNSGEEAAAPAAAQQNSPLLETKKKQLMVPLFYSSHKKVEKKESGGATKLLADDYKLWGLPLLYYRAKLSPRNSPEVDSVQSRAPPAEPGETLALADFENSDQLIRQKSLFLMGFYYQRSGLSSHYNFLYLFDYHKSRNRQSFGALFNLISYDDNSSFTRFQLLYGGLFSNKRYRENGEYNGYNSWNLLWLARGRLKDRTYTSFLPLFHYRTSAVDGEDRNRGYSRQLFLPLLLTYLKSYSNTDQNYTYFIAGLYFNKRPDYARHNIFFLYDYRYETEADRHTYGYIFHALHYQKSPELKKFYLFYRLLFGIDYKGVGNYKYNLFWYIHEKRPEYSTSALFPFWYYKKHFQHNSSELGLLLNSFYYEKTPEYKKFEFLWSLGFSYTYYNPKRYDFSVLKFIYQQERHDTSFSSNFFPFWFWKSDQRYHRLLILPLLTYIEKDGENIYQNVGPWWIWYRNYNANTTEDRTHLLSGLLYSSHKYPIRGYSSYGSLWGLLWKYEKEKETGFRKLRVLMLPIYKKVRDESGVLRKYIMGIRVN